MRKVSIYAEGRDRNLIKIIGLVARAGRYGDARGEPLGSHIPDAAAWP